MEMNNYSCSLNNEMKKYLELLESAGKHTSHVKSLFNVLNRILQSKGSQKYISEADVLAWDSQLDCSPATRKKSYSALRGFMKYLTTCGISCKIPQLPRAIGTRYSPYIFNKQEWNSIITEADNLASSLKRTGTDMPIIFPMIIRVLYSCGLRLSEALSLKTADIDLKNECLIIRKAKRKKQRIVPMKSSMTELMKLFIFRLGLPADADAYLFAGTDGKPYSNSWVQRWFNATIERTEIRCERSRIHERGICPHCIRHTFTFCSFQNSTNTFEEMVPFLSTYLGHANIMETDHYLRFSYELYEEAHSLISEYTNGIFPEVVK